MPRLLLLLLLLPLLPLLLPRSCVETPRMRLHLDAGGLRPDVINGVSALLLRCSV
jgi:hypothetical protein